LQHALSRVALIPTLHAQTGLSIVEKAAKRAAKRARKQLVMA